MELGTFPWIRLNTFTLNKTFEWFPTFLALLIIWAIPLKTTPLQAHLVESLKSQQTQNLKWHMPGIWGIHNPFLVQLRWYQPQLWTKSLGNTYCKVSSKLIAITSFHSIDSTMEWKEKPPESPWNTELRVNKAFAKRNHLLVCCFT